MTLGINHVPSDGLKLLELLFAPCPALTYLQRDPLGSKPHFEDLVPLDPPPPSPPTKSGTPKAPDPCWPGKPSPLDVPDAIILTSTSLQSNQLKPVRAHA